MVVLPNFAIAMASEFAAAAAVAVAGPPAGSIDDNRPSSSGNLHRQHMDRSRSIAHIGRCSRPHWLFLEPLKHQVPLGSKDSSTSEVVTADPDVDAAVVGDDNYHSRNHHSDDRGHIRHNHGAADSP